MSSGGQALQTITKTSVTGAPDIDGIATRDGNSLNILLWNYHDEDVSAPDSAVSLAFANIPATEIHITRTVVDGHHANAYAAWQAMGSPQQLSTQQLATLRKAVVLLHLTW